MFGRLQMRSAFRRAQAAYEKGRFEQSLELLKPLKDAGYRPRQLALFEAASFYSLRRFDEAQAVIAALPEVAEREALLDYIEARIKAASGDWDAARLLAQKAFDKDGFNTRIEHFLGLCFLRKGDLERTADHFENVLRYDRRLVDARLLLLAEMEIMNRSEGNEIFPRKLFFN